MMENRPLISGIGNPGSTRPFPEDSGLFTKNTH